MQYEICYLVGESKDAILEATKQEVEKMIEAAGGKLLEGEFLEKKKLAYKVQKDIRGTYVARRFELVQAEDAEKDAVAELGHKLNLHTDLLRSIIIKADDLPALGTKIDVPARHGDRGAKKESQSRPMQSRDRRPSAPIAKAAPVVQAAPAEKVEKAEPAKSDSIDQKLEEILNI